MTQSQQQSERKFIAVRFGGVPPMSRQRTALTVAGPAGLDVPATLEASLPEPEEIDEDGARQPQTVPGDARLLLGGEGARAAYAYAALGGAARFAGAIGDDPAGEVALRWLSERGVDTTAVQRAGRTPVGIVLAPPGYRPLLVHREAPAAETPPTGSSLAGAEGTLLLAGYPYGGVRGAVAAALLRAARAQGLRTVLSLSPVALGGPGTPLTPVDLEEALPEVDLICGGPAELRRATRRADAQEAARVLLDRGARSVLAKRGAEGAALYRPGPAALEREDTSTPAAAMAGAGASQLHLAAAFGAVFDAAYLLAIAFNDAGPVRSAAAAAVRAAASPRGVLGL